MSLSAFAVETNIWNNASGDGTWSNVENWSLGKLPGNIDRVSLCPRFPGETLNIDVEGGVTIGTIFITNKAMRIKLWGEVDAGSEIVVKFAGQAKTTTADARGRWRVNCNQMGEAASAAAAHAVREGLSATESYAGNPGGSETETMRRG